MGLPVRRTLNSPVNLQMAVSLAPKQNPSRQPGVSSCLAGGMSVHDVVGWLARTEKCRVQTCLTTRGEPLLKRSPPFFSLFLKLFSRPCVPLSVLHDANAPKPSPTNRVIASLVASLRGPRDEPRLDLPSPVIEALIIRRESYIRTHCSRYVSSSAREWIVG
jgi:hypothetical protein